MRSFSEGADGGKDNDEPPIHHQGNGENGDETLGERGKPAGDNGGIVQKQQNRMGAFQGRLHVREEKIDRKTDKAILRIRRQEWKVAARILALARKYRKGLVRKVTERGRTQDS